MKFGSLNIDSVRFGSTAVQAIYFGSQQVWSAGPTARTLYFYASTESDWSLPENWWLDDTYQTQADTLPSAADNVVVGAGIELFGNTGPQPEVSNVTVIDGFFAITVTVTGLATFNGASANGNMLFGNAVFNGTSQNNHSVIGSATFNGSSSNNGQVGADAVFNGNSVNTAFVNGRATYNDSSSYTCDAGSVYKTYNSTAPQPVYGCTDPSATNYNPSAVCEDYSCCYPYAYSEFLECVGCETATFAIYDSCGTFEGTYTDNNYGACSGLCAAFEPTAVLLTSGTNYTVPANATTMKAWAVGSGTSSAGGTAYKEWSVSGGQTVAYAVAAKSTTHFGNDSSVTFGGVTIIGRGAGRNANGTNKNAFASGGGEFTGGDGGVAGGVDQYLGGGDTRFGAVGGNNDAVTAVTINTKPRFAASDVSGLFAALQLAGQNTTLSAANPQAFGSGGLTGKYDSTATAVSPGLGGGGGYGTGCSGCPFTDNRVGGAVVLLFT